MKTAVLTGPKQQIADQVARIPGDIVRAIIFVEDLAERASSRGAPPADPWMHAFQAILDNAVTVGQDVDDSRESIYQGRGE